MPEPVCIVAWISTTKSVVLCQKIRCCFGPREVAGVAKGLEAGKHLDLFGSAIFKSAGRMKLAKLVGKIN